MHSAIAIAVGKPRQWVDELAADQAIVLATIGQNEFVTAQKSLFDIAQRIGVPIAEVSTLYGKLQQAVRTLGGEQKDALTIP